VSLQAVLEPNAPERAQLSDPVQVVVFNDGDRSMGMVVDQIVDVAEEAVTIRRKSARKGLLGSAVVAKRITDFLDLNQVIDSARDSWFQTMDVCVNAKRILITDPSAFSRGMVRSGLDMAGYVVHEATNLDEAMHCLEQQPVDVILAALNLPDEGSSALLAATRNRPDWENIPVLAIADSAENMRVSECRAAGFNDCQTSFDSAAILESVARLVSASDLDEAPLECVGEKK
jgi:two-component system chemotaxis sensor kinase CheA